VTSNELHHNRLYNLGLLIIFAYIILFGSSLLYSFIKDYNNNDNSTMPNGCCNDTSKVVVINNHNDQSFQSIEKVSATFGPIVAGVVGYYFGQRQSESSEKRADESGKDLRKAIEVLEKKFADEEARRVADSELAANLLKQIGDDATTLKDDEHL
jgi:hypothetical protein